MSDIARSAETLTERQRTLLQALHTSEWRRAPNGTLGPTLVALWNRGLIEPQLADGANLAHRYSDAYVWRLK